MEIILNKEQKDFNDTERLACTQDFLEEGAPGADLGLEKGGVLTETGALARPRNFWKPRPLPVKIRLFCFFILLF